MPPPKGPPAPFPVPPAGATKKLGLIYEYDEPNGPAFSPCFIVSYNGHSWVFSKDATVDTHFMIAWGVSGLRIITVGGVDYYDIMVVSEHGLWVEHVTTPIVRGAPGPTYMPYIGAPVLPPKPPVILTPSPQSTVVPPLGKHPIDEQDYTSPGKVPGTGLSPHIRPPIPATPLDPSLIIKDPLTGVPAKPHGIDQFLNPSGGGGLIDLLRNRGGGGARGWAPDADSSLGGVLRSDTGSLLGSARPGASRTSSTASLGGSSGSGGSGGSSTSSSAEHASSSIDEGTDTSGSGDTSSLSDNAGSDLGDLNNSGRQERVVSEWMLIPDDQNDYLREHTGQRWMPNPIDVAATVPTGIPALDESFLLTALSSPALPAGMPPSPKSDAGLDPSGRPASVDPATIAAARDPGFVDPVPYDRSAQLGLATDTSLAGGGGAASSDPHGWRHLALYPDDDRMGGIVMPEATPGHGPTPTPGGGPDPAAMQGMNVAMRGVAIVSGAQTQVVVSSNLADSTRRVASVNVVSTPRPRR